MKSAWILAVAMGLYGCDGAGEAFVEKCSQASIATHDFGTNDLVTLARVRAFNFAGGIENAAILSFAGSLALAECAGPSGSVTFVLEPD